MPINRTRVTLRSTRATSWGYQFVAVGADVGLLARHADALAKKFKG